MIAVETQFSQQGAVLSVELREQDHANYVSRVWPHPWRLNTNNSSIVWRMNINNGSKEYIAMTPTMVQ
jgi:hypothetical protein